MTRGPSFVVVPVTLRGAAAFIRAHHRHHKPPRGAFFAIGAAVSLGEARVLSSGRVAYRYPIVGEIVGIAMVGRPVARMLQRGGWTSEALRVASDGTPNACSFLYSRAWRAAQALGWRRLVTYTLPEEGGGVAARRWAEGGRERRRRFLEPRGPAAHRRASDAGEAPVGGRVA